MSYIRQSNATPISPETVEVLASLIGLTLPAEDLAAYVSKQVACSQYPFQARVILHSPLESISERISPTAGVLEALDAQRCRLHTGAHSLEYLAVTLALIGAEFEIEEPEELIDHVRRIADVFTRATQAPREQERLAI